MAFRRQVRSLLPISLQGLMGWLLQQQPHHPQWHPFGPSYLSSSFQVPKKKSELNSPLSTHYQAPSMWENHMQSQTNGVLLLWGLLPQISISKTYSFCKARLGSEKHWPWTRGWWLINSNMKLPSATLPRRSGWRDLFLLIQNSKSTDSWWRNKLMAPLQLLGFQRWRMRYLTTNSLWLKISLPKPTDLLDIISLQISHKQIEQFICKVKLINI